MGQDLHRGGARRCGGWASSATCTRGAAPTPTPPRPVPPPPPPPTRACPRCSCRRRGDGRGRRHGLARDAAEEAQGRAEWTVGETIADAEEGGFLTEVVVHNADAVAHVAARVARAGARPCLEDPAHDSKRRSGWSASTASTAGRCSTRSGCTRRTTTSTARGAGTNWDFQWLPSSWPLVPLTGPHGREPPRLRARPQPAGPAPAARGARARLAGRAPGARVAVAARRRDPDARARPTRAGDPGCRYVMPPDDPAAGGRGAAGRAGDGAARRAGRGAAAHGRGAALPAERAGRRVVRGRARCDLAYLSPGAARCRARSRRRSRGSSSKPTR